MLHLNNVTVHWEDMTHAILNGKSLQVMVVAMVTTFAELNGFATHWCQYLVFVINLDRDTNITNYVQNPKDSFHMPCFPRTVTL